MLTLADINQSYGQSHTLWDISLEIPKGGCVSLIGRNGVGKTTLLNCIMGLLRLDSGTIVFDGKDISGMPPESRAAMGIGYVPQGRMIFPLLTVHENLQTGMAAIPRRERRIPEMIFELFPVLRDMLDRRGGDLSGGQQQQLAIARALVLTPRLLILDEPTEGIQPNIVQQIGDIISKLNRELGLTVLVVEQKLPFVKRVTNRFSIMTKGSIVADDEMPALSDALIAEHLSV
ncbi:MAG: urea ABC transporter ATP-binding subunit UrtE [Gammaproteobacteria bacterium]|nr:urea ABC transporter ATP-binding subunit UrtE [Gammaproteobacteria bacterium]OUU08373.1 MAG: urea ABC transporter ATP-binding subunit UrtE [Gammaproteobacteria bacterium TMED34]